MPLLPEEFLISSRRGSNPLPDRFVIKERANPFHVLPLVAIGAAEGVGFEGIGKPAVRAVQRAAARDNFGAAGGAGAHTFRRNNFSPVASLIEGLAAGIGVGITATPVQRLFERYSATHRRMNSDEDMRALERAAAQGDVLARERLARMQQRTSVDVFRLDVGIRDYIRPADYAKFDATPSNYQVVAERYDGGRGIRVTGPRFGPRNGRLLNASEYYGVMYDGVYKSFGSRNSVASRMARSIERLLRGERPRGSYVTKASSHRSVTLVSRVDNLGWLLRAAGKRVIASIRVETSHQGADAHLNVFFRDGTIYESDFDDRGVLWGFLDRPVFRGVPIHWFGVPMGEVTKSRRYWTGTPDGIITRRHNSDEDMRALERAAQLGDPAAIQRLAAHRARMAPVRRANMPGAFIFAIGNGSGPRGPVRPVAQHRAARRPNEGGGYRIKLPADRVLGTMPLAEARRRWPNIGIDVQVDAFEDFNRGAKAHPTVILEDDGRREVGADWLGARVPEIVYGGVDGHAPGSFKNSGGVVGGDESESTTWVHQSPNQYLIGHAEVDRDGRPVTRDFRLIGDTVAKAGWLRR